MRDNINFIAFETINKNLYIYDNQSSLIMPTNNLQLEILNLYKKNKPEEEIRLFLLKNSLNPTIIDKELKNINDLFYKYKMFNSENIYQDKIVLNSKERIAKKGIKQLILLVTQDCNLRCKYCAFSGHYQYNRIHQKKHMSIEVAKKAIDFYFKIYHKSFIHNPTQKPVIGFYGGEPLLAFDVIKYTVNYINTTYKDIDVSYSITTNGTLLADRVVDFLIENDFSINISLDGPECENDRNRVFVNGLGTFNKVIESIEKVYQRQQKLEYNKVDFLPFSVLACYDNDTDLVKVAEFFDSSELLAGKVQRISKINEIKTTYYKNKGSNPSIGKIYNNLLNMAKNNTFDKNSYLYVFFALNFINFIARNFYIKNVTRGNCYPGVKVAIDYKGYIHMCEKINDHYPIGNIGEGFYYSKIDKYVKQFFNHVNDFCKECNISNLCTQCFMLCEDSHDKFKIDLENCKKKKENIPKILGMMYSLLEENPKIFEEIN